MSSIGPLELAIVLVIALIVLGPKRLPDAGRSLGRGMREFKDGLTNGSEKPPEVPLLQATADPPKGAGRQGTATQPDASMS